MWPSQTSVHFVFTCCRRCRWRKECLFCSLLHACRCCLVVCLGEQGWIRLAVCDAGGAVFACIVLLLRYVQDATGASSYDILVLDCMCNTCWGHVLSLWNLRVWKTELLGGDTGVTVCCSFPSRLCSRSPIGWWWQSLHLSWKSFGNCYQTCSGELPTSYLAVWLGNIISLLSWFFCCPSHIPLCALPFLWSILPPYIDPDRGECWSHDVWILLFRRLGYWWQSVPRSPGRIPVQHSRALQVSIKKNGEWILGE